MVIFATSLAEPNYLLYMIIADNLQRTNRDPLESNKLTRLHKLT